MTIWHVQKLYTSNGVFHTVLPYDFRGTMKVTLKMKNGIWQMIKFLSDSRLTERAAHSLCTRKNRNLQVCPSYMEAQDKTQKRIQSRFRQGVAECNQFAPCFLIKRDIIVVTERNNSNRKVDKHEHSSILPSFHR